MTIVECWGCEVFVNRVNFKLTKRVNRSYSMLPYITNDIIKSICLEHIHWIWRKPVLKVHITSLTMLPFIQIHRKKTSNGKVFVFCWKPDISALFLTFPGTKSLSLKVVNLDRPVPRHRNDVYHRSQMIMGILNV